MNHVETAVAEAKQLFESGDEKSAVRLLEKTRRHAAQVSDVQGLALLIETGEELQGRVGSQEKALERFASAARTNHAYALRVATDAGSVEDAVDEAKRMLDAGDSKSAVRRLERARDAANQRIDAEALERLVEAAAELRSRFSGRRAEALERMGNSAHMNYIYARRADLAHGGVGEGASGTVIPQSDLLARLRRLTELRDAGTLTEEEYAAQKAELLARP